MLTEILRESRTVVKQDSEKNIDSYFDLLAELHQFLDRLVSEPQKFEDFDPEEVFIGRNGDA